MCRDSCIQVSQGCIEREGGGKVRSGSDAGRSFPPKLC